MIQINPICAARMSVNDLSFLIKLCSISTNNRIEKMSLSRIQSLINSSPITIKNAIDRLSDLGAIKVVTNSFNSGGTEANSYILNKDFCISSTSRFMDYIKDDEVIEPYSVKNNNTFVYLIRDNSNSLYKIGSASSVRKRLSSLKCSNPNIEVLHSVKTEKILESQLHLKFENKRVYGEWFDLNSFDLEFILSIKDGYVIAKINDLDESHFPCGFNERVNGFTENELNKWASLNNLIITKNSISKTYKEGDPYKFICEFVAQDLHGNTVIKRTFKEKTYSKCIKKIVCAGKYKN